MIRPVTCVCFMLACASGLYLYQSKHKVQLLDREIEQTVRATDALREQTRILHAEWTLLNDPQRLQGMADQFLALKTVAPAQFSSLADLNNRLPAVRPPEPPPKDVIPDLPQPMVSQAGPLPQVEELPVPPSLPAVVPAPVKPLAVASLPAPRVVEPKPAPPSPPRQALASPPPPPPRPVQELRVPQPEPRVSTVTYQPNQLHAPAAPVIQAGLPVQRASVPAPMMGGSMAGGSMLGMAHVQAPPPPAPLPVGAVPWNANGGGGN